MTTKRYTVMPGVVWVAGRPVPSDRSLLLTDEEALYDLLLGRIILAGSGGTTPAVEPAIEESDVLLMRRGGLERRLLVEDLMTFLRSRGVGGASIGLSTSVFATGAAKDTILAAISAPDGWRVEAETTFGGRAKVSGRQLLAAQLLAAPATGSIRLRATSPDDATSVTQSFAVAVTGAAVADTTAPVVTSAAAFTVAENAAFETVLSADEAVTWAKVPGADAALFTLDGAKLSLAARDYEAPGDADANNVYRVNLTATDAAGNVTPFTVDVTVTNVLEGTLAAIAPTTGAILTTAAAGSLVLDLPPKVEGEARSFLTGNPLAVDTRFTFSTAGKLIVGASALSSASVSGTIRQARNGQQVDTTVTITVSEPSSDAPPVVPAYDLAQTSYGLSSANHLEAVDQNGIKLPAGASALPAVDADWFDWLFFSTDEMLQHAVAGYAIASKGTSGHAISGGSQTGLNVRGGLGTTGLDPFTVGFAASNPANRQFFPDMVRSPAIERGAAHVAVFGQKGRFPFWALVRVNLDGKTDPVIITSQVGAANDGLDGWRYTSAGAARWSAGGYDLLSGFGGNVDAADGSNRRGAGGAIGQFVNIWGSFPFVNGSPDPDLLKSIANGTVDPLALANTVSGTLRYANHMRGPADLAADARGVITAAATELAGLNANCKPFAAAPMRRPPELRLRSYGDGFVFPMGANKAGPVPFRGSFTGTAAADSFEARLVRVDNGAALVGWTTLVSTIDNAAKTFVASLPGVPSGVAFRREIRWKRRPEIAYRDADRVALGIVVADVGQSQLAYQGYASNSGDAGSGANLVPSSDDNRWISVVKQAFFTNAQAQSTSFWSAALFKPYAAGQHGDGNIATFEQIKRTLGVPVMFVDTATPGTHPNRWLSDRQTFAYSGFGTFAPDGSTTAFSFTPVSTALRQDGDTNAPASCVPGSFQMTVGSVSITDDGNGNLVGAGITAGTINYQTGAITSLTFSVAPAAGVATSGSFQFFAVAPETSVLPQAGAMSMFGDTAQPLDSTYKRGRLMLHLSRLRNVAPSIYRVFWFTAFSTASQATVSSLFDRLRAKIDAAFPAGAVAPMGVILPGRQNNGAEGTGSNLMNPTHRAALTGKTGFRILGDALDFEIANNNGPHQDPALSRSFSERLGAAIASAHVSDWNANGPVIVSANFTGTSRTAIDVTFSLASGSALTTADASTTGIQGFAVGPSGTAENAWDRTGFTAAITGPTTVRLTKTSGSWSAGQRVAYANGAPISTGTSSTKAADNASLLKMLSDNDNAYAGQPKFTSRVGNIARVNPGMAIDEVPLSYVSTNNNADLVVSGGDSVTTRNA